MVDVMTAQTPSEGSSDAQAAAAARKARRKKTRWGADVEPAQGDKGEAQAGSTEIPSVTSVPGSVFAANAPPQQELTSLKLNSSVPSGTPVHSQPSSASVSGQNAAFSTSVSSQGQPPPWLAKGQTELANGNVDTPPVKDAEVLPGPPPQPNAQQPWLPQSAPAAHPNGAHPMHSAPPGAAYQGYGAEYYFQHPGGYPVSHLHPAGVKPAADDDRPPGVEGEDGDEALPGEEPAATPPAAALSGAPAGVPFVPSTGSQAEPQLPGPPTVHPHPATAPPSFPSSSAPGSSPFFASSAAAAPYAQPYPQLYPHPHYPPQYALPAYAAAEAVDAEPGPPGAEDEPKAPGTDGEAQAAATYGYPEGYTDPAYAYGAQQYGSYTDPQTGYTYPYDPQQYGYDQSYYGYAQYAQTGEAGDGAVPGADASGQAPDAPSDEPGPPAGSPKKEPKAEGDGKPSKPLPPVVQVKLPKHYQEKMQAKKREEEERRQQEAARKIAEAEERRKAAAEEAAAAAARRAQLRRAADYLFKKQEPSNHEEAHKPMFCGVEASWALLSCMQTFLHAPRWRDNDDREIEGELKASKRRRASPGFEPRLRTSPVFEPWQRASPGFEPRAKGPLRRSPSMSPAFREPLMHRSPPRRRPPVREPSPERPRVRRPRGYRRKASSLSASPARYTPQPPQEHEPQPAPKPQPTEEEKAAAEAEAAVAAREATPEVSEEGEIPVDPEEMEVLSKAQQQPAPKIGHQHSPTRRHTSDRGRDRAPDRDRDTLVRVVEEKGQSAGVAEAETYDAPYGVYGSALGTAAASGGPYGQYGSYMG
ncbi:MAG: hypothetical protein FRX49_08670 [Trebouxia sp. A1-2]|nr:MAG: hypothetical protein FRX49_08670 [Trebouxia sp. A1-2]